MEDQIQALQKLTKTKQFNDVPAVIKTSLGILLNISKATHQKLSQHYDLYYDIVSKTQQQNFAIEREIARLSNSDNTNQESEFDHPNFIEKQNGLDKVMIHEVKELAEAVVENKLKHFENQVLRKYDYEIEINVIEEQIDSLKNKIDDFLKTSNNEVHEKIRQQKLQLFEEFSKSSRLIGFGQTTARQTSKIFKVESQIENIRHSIRNTFENNNFKDYQEIKMNIGKKLDKKQLIDFKSKVNKELSKKVTLEQVQSLITKFQNKVFDRFNQITQKTQHQQQNITKSIKNQLEGFSDKQNLISEKFQGQVRRQIQRLNKKVGSQKEKTKNCKLEQKLQQLQQRATVLEQKVENQFQEIASMLSSPVTEPQNKTFNMSVIAKSHSMVKLVSSNVDTKGRLIPWQEQECNLHKQNYLWEQFKTSLYLVCPGIYYLKVVVGSMKKISAQLLVNGEFRLSLESNQEWSYKDGQTLYYFGVLALTQKSKLNIKTSEDVRVDAAIILTKMV